MTDTEGSLRQAHTGSSGPNDDGNRREQARRPTGRAERADGVRQSADALRESSRSILATLDAVAQLFERARRGEECPEEEGERIAAMVEDSRKTLTGVVAGFAAADLLAALTPAPETEQRPSAPNRAGGAGGRTYAQAARTGPPPPENRPGPPQRQAPPRTMGAGAHCAAPPGGGPPAPGPDSRQRVRRGAGPSAPVRPGAGSGSRGGIGPTNGKG